MIRYFTAGLLVAYLAGCTQRGEMITIGLDAEMEVNNEEVQMQPDIEADYGAEDVFYVDSSDTLDLIGDGSDDDLSDKLIQNRDEGIAFLVEQLQSKGFFAKNNTTPVTVKDPETDKYVNITPDIYFSLDPENPAKDSYLDFVAEDEEPIGLLKAKFPFYAEVFSGMESEILEQLNTLLGL
jgi:hypothetical protein